MHADAVVVHRLVAACLRASSWQACIIVQAEAAVSVRVALHESKQAARKRGRHHTSTGGRGIHMQGACKGRGEARRPRMQDGNCRESSEQSKASRDDGTYGTGTVGWGGARTETANRQRVARQHMQQHGLTDGALLRCTCTCLCARPPARSIALRPSLQAAERDSAWPVGGVAVRADHGQRHAPALHYLCMLASLVAAFPLQYLPRARCRAARVGCNPTKPCRSPVT